MMLQLPMILLFTMKWQIGMAEASGVLLLMLKCTKLIFTSKSKGPGSSNGLQPLRVESEMGNPHYFLPVENKVLEQIMIVISSHIMQSVGC